MDRSKLHDCDCYLVVSVEGAWCNICKFTGTQFWSNSYCIKIDECYKVPSDFKYTAQVRKNCCTTEDLDDGDIADSAGTQLAEPTEPFSQPIEENQPFALPPHVPAEIAEPIDLIPLSTTTVNAGELVTVPNPSTQEDDTTVNKSTLCHSNRTRNLPGHLHDYEMK